MNALLIALIIVGIVIVYYHVMYTMTIYRFYRPGCPYCVRSQAAWNEFRRRCMFKHVKCRGINLDEEDPDDKILAERFQVRSVPTVIAVNDDRAYSYEGERTADAMEQWVDVILSIDKRIR